MHEGGRTAFENFFIVVLIFVIHTTKELNKKKTKTNRLRALEQIKFHEQGVINNQDWKYRVNTHTFRDGSVFFLEGMKRKKIQEYIVLAAFLALRSQYPIDNKSILNKELCYK